MYYNLGNSMLHIGTYKPKRWRGSIIGPAILEITRSYGLVPLINDSIQRNAKPIWASLLDHAEVRRTAIVGSEGTSWHQDGDTTTDEMDFGLVLWSQHNCTEFKYPDNIIIQAKPFEIIYIDNLECYHRRPPNVSGKRWSFRQRVERI